MIKPNIFNFLSIILIAVTCSSCDALSYNYSDVPGLRRGAESGNPTAQTMLGACYLYGFCLHVEKNNAEAVNWIRKAADQGQPLAEFDMGEFYREGRGVQKNDAEAVEWFRKSAEHGNRFGQGNLAYAYQIGFGGLPKDDVQAYMWNELASDHTSLMEILDGKEPSTAKRRVELEKSMTPEQIAEAKRLADEWEQKH